MHDIVKSQAKLESFQKEVEEGDCVKKRKIVRRANYEELDKAVYLWFVQQRSKGKNSNRSNSYSRHFQFSMILLNFCRNTN